MRRGVNEKTCETGKKMRLAGKLPRITVKFHPISRYVPDPPQFSLLSYVVLIYLQLSHDVLAEPRRLPIYPRLAGDN